jgi:hypothetical protein
MFPWMPYVLVPLLVWGGAWMVRRFLHRQRPEQPGTFKPQLVRPLILAMCWFFAPLVLAWVSTAIDLARLFFPRYVIVTAVAPLVVAGLGSALCPGRVSRGICVSGTLIVAIWQSGMIEQCRYDGRLVGSRNQDWRSAAARINSATQYARWPVFVSSGFLEADGLCSGDLLHDYCRSPLHTLYRVDRADPDLVPLPTTHPGRLSPECVQRAVAAGGAWFVVLGQEERIEQTQREVQQCFRAAEHPATLAERASFGNVAVLRIAVQTADGRKQ